MKACLEPPVPLFNPDALSSELWRGIAESGPSREGGYPSVGPYRQREAFRSRYSYAVPSPAAIERIARFVGHSKLLEVAAGRGLWSRFLRDEGVSVDATDAHGGPTSFGVDSGFPALSASSHVFCPIRTVEAAVAAERSDAAVLMIIWPPYGRPVARDSLANFRGDRLVYIGEPRGGCTASDAFFDLLADEWSDDGEMLIESWSCLDDRIFFYRRASSVPLAANSSADKGTGA